MDSTESFARLVHGANPAVASHYPPTAAAAMDPFFDDDDDDLLDSSTHAYPMRSQESGLPLTDAAAPPAHTGRPQGWLDNTFQGSASFPGMAANKSPSPRPRKRKKWKWPWEKPPAPTGERIIALNNPTTNDDFGDNFVSTSKYNPATFLPKFLKGTPLPFISHCHLTAHTEQFSKYANIFFLFTAVIQQVPNVSPTNQYTTIVPLAIVLLVSAFKEMQEDLVSLLSLSQIPSHTPLETTPIRLGAQCSYRKGALSVLDVRTAQVERHLRRRHRSCRVRRVHPRRSRAHLLVRTRGALFHRDIQPRRVCIAPFTSVRAYILPAKQISRSNKHLRLLPNLPHLRSSHPCTVPSVPNNPTTPSTLSKALWSSFPMQVSPVRSPLVQIKCSCVVHSYEIPLGYTASLSLLAMKPN